MKRFEETAGEIVIVDETGKPLLAGDNEWRFFESAWMHRCNRKYYFSYSVGDTHFVCYAIADNPYGHSPTRGEFWNLLWGWASHQPICQFQDKWYLFYHDSSLSEGVTHVRSAKVTELSCDASGKIQTINPYATE